MKKLLTIITVILISTLTINAQKTELGVQAGVAIPSGDFGDLVTTGFGGQASFILNLNSQTCLTASLGYYTWSGKDDITTLLNDYKFSTLPLMVGARYYFTPKNFQPYILGEVGFFFSSYSYTTPSFDLGFFSTGGEDVSDSGTDFGFAFGAGFRLPIGKTTKLDVNAKYNNISADDAIKYISISAGVTFALGK